MAKTLYRRSLISMLSFATFSDLQLPVYAASMVSLIDLKDLGEALGAAADAIGKLGDDIAHLIEFGVKTYSAASAENTRRRLIEITASLVQIGLSTNVKIWGLSP